MFVHLTLVPYLSASGELKTKPTQQSAGVLRGIGIIPDMMICRTEHPLEEEHFQKISLFCNVPRTHVVEEQNVKHSIYEVPIELAEQKVDCLILEHFGLEKGRLDLDGWKSMVRTAIFPEGGQVEIAVVGKYISLPDAYKSIYEALRHGAIANDYSLEVRRVEAEDIQESEGGAEALLAGVDGILIPGGFGYRGIEGKIEAARYARESSTPFLGICLGMQCAVIETARNVAGLSDANSTEFDSNTCNPVVALMDEQKNVVNKGGTMRLGAYPCCLSPESAARSAYRGKDQIHERHRHRFEINNDFREALAGAGITFSGLSPDGKLVEIIERPDHPWFVACQFHPEFRSRPLGPHPLFSAFIAAAGR
jgi:CTP synthase